MTYVMKTGDQIKLSSSKGAAMVEFILPFLMFFLLIAGIVDIGITYYRFNLLVFVSQKVNREIAVNLGENLDLASIRNLAQQRLVQTFADFGHVVDGAELSVGDTEIDCSEGPNRCYLVLTDITWHSISILGAFFWNKFPVKTSSKILIEDPCYYTL